MKALLRHPTQFSTLLITGRSGWSTTAAIERNMTGQHICLCCANTLLRHIRLGGIYWRCSHCYQEMPVQEFIASL